MSTRTTAERLEVLQRSLFAARKSVQGSSEDYADGLRDGLQLAIDAVNLELRIIAAGQGAACAHAQPQ